MKSHVKNLMVALMLIGLICGVASAQESTGDRIWDADANQSLEYTWTAQSYSGFYYDLDSGEGSENLSIRLDNENDRSIGDGDLVYTTRPVNTDFEHDEWGSYQIIGFMAERYFAGYTQDTEFADDTVSVMADGQLTKILLDDDDEQSFFSGSSLLLEEGYTLEIVEVDLDGDSVLVSLEKDGDEVDSGIVSANDDYIYEIDLGSTEDVAIIVVHFNDIFRGRESNAVFIEGIFQISDEYVEIDTGDSFGEMEVSTISATEIEMENDGTISLGRGDTVEIMGSLNFIVADDDTLRFGPFVDMSEPGIYEVRGTVVEGMNLTWTPLNFEGFYYNIDEGIGTESLEITSLNGRNIEDGDLVYSTRPEQVSFEREEWGEFQVIGFLAEKYFAGYPDNEFTDSVSMLGDGQLSKVLIDNDERNSIFSGSSLVLEDGYRLEIVEVDLDGDSVLVSLEKDGRQVDSGVVSSDDDYVYELDLGSTEDVPLVIVHFADIFRGTETNAVFVEGIFQISDEYLELDTSDTFGEMEVATISASGITLENDDDISLSRDRTVSIMGEVSFRVADSSTLRFYPFVTVATAPLEPLSIEMPVTLVEDESVTITVTSRGAAVPDAVVMVDGERIGTTSQEGEVSYAPGDVGDFTVTAEKEGFVSAELDIEVISSDDESRKLAIEVSPDVVFEGETITITVIRAIGGQAVEDVNVLYDGNSIGTTSDDGEVTYVVSDPGVHKITTSASGFLPAEFNLEVRESGAEFEYSGLTITPAQIDSGESVTISVNVTNIGTMQGEETVELMINGNMVDSSIVTLDAGEETTVEFTRTETEAGTYEVQIATESGTYTVAEGIPAVGIFASVMILISAAFIAVRYRRKD